MSKPYTTDGTPPTGDVFAGTLETVIEESEPGETLTGKYCAKVQMRTTDANPEGYGDKIHYETYTIGIEGDEGADDPLTFTKKASFGFKRLRDLFVATRLQRSNDLDDDIRRLKGHKFLGSYGPQVDKETKDVRTRLNKVFAVGARPLMTRSVDPDTGKMGPPEVVGSTPPPSATSSAPAGAGAPPPPPPQ